MGSFHVAASLCCLIGSIIALNSSYEDRPRLELQLAQEILKLDLSAFLFLPLRLA